MQPINYLTHAPFLQNGELSYVQLLLTKAYQGMPVIISTRVGISAVPNIHVH